MLTELFNYRLPERLIAQNPSAKRDCSRLLVLHRSTGRIDDRQFTDICDYFKKNDLLVINDTRVLPARFAAKRKSGASIQGLYLQQTPEKLWLVMLKNARRLKPSEKFDLISKNKTPAVSAIAVEKLPDGKWLINPQTSKSPQTLLQEIGYAPLPPYISRDLDNYSDPDYDLNRYQTVYAKTAGAVAAPTAGLHFTDRIFEKLEKIGVNRATVTLHVGAGTFKPVTAQHIEDHKMHSESYEITSSQADLINNAKARNHRIIAVGTTSVRTLESASTENAKVTPGSASTKLFIKPGCSFNMTDAIITNFHLPKSTLLALVCAFAGTEQTLNAYRHAVKNNYRFYSFGDAMLII